MNFNLYDRNDSFTKRKYVSINMFWERGLTGQADCAVCFIEFWE